MLRFNKSSMLQVGVYHIFFNGNFAGQINNSSNEMHSFSFPSWNS